MALIGSINFINSLPVDYGMISGHTSKAAFEIFRDYPESLNINFFKLNPVISPVSALFFAQHHQDLFCVPDLSISSDSSVDSVILISNKPISEFTGMERIAVSSKGRTTPCLLKIILQLRYGLNRSLIEANLQPEKAGQSYDAKLLIGDEALQYIGSPVKSYPIVTDLGHEWRQWTGLPFVFAVWVFPRNLYAQKSELVQSAARVVCDSRKYSKSHFEEVLDYASKHSGFEKTFIKNYFGLLNYDLTSEHVQAMTHYAQYASELGYLEELGDLSKLIQTDILKEMV